MCRASCKASPDRGLVESTQLALLLPLLLLSLFAVVQAGIWLAGRSTVQQAAMAGAEQAGFVDANPARAPRGGRHPPRAPACRPRATHPQQLAGARRSCV